MSTLQFAEFLHDVDQLNLLDINKLKNNPSAKIGVYSFFAGAGFLDLGFELTDGFEIIFVNEYHSPFMDVYKSSRAKLGLQTPAFGHHTDTVTSFLAERENFIQTSLITARKKFDIVGFIGGPPCPDFSVGGKNKGIKGDNGKLSATYVELIIKNQPDFFLFENVKGLYRTKKHRMFFDEVKSKLTQNGYLLTEKLINAIEFGAPQNRERIILIGFRQNHFVDLGLELKDTPAALNSFDWNAKTSYSADKIFSQRWPTQEPFAENSTKPFPNGLSKELTVEYWFQKNNVENHQNASHFFKPRAGLAKIQSIQEGDDLKKSYKRLHRWRYSPTVAYGNNEVHLHPYKVRRISVAEALALQSLPRDFVIPENISLTNMFKTIGNGVPYLAAKGLAETIKDFVQSYSK